LSTVQELESNIVKWIKEEQWKYTKVDTPDFALCYKVDLNRNHELTVAYIQNAERFIIDHKMVLTKEDDISYKLSSNKYKYKFMFQIESDLLPMTMFLNFEPSIENLHTIRVYKFIHLGEFNRMKFVDTLREIEHVIDMIDEAWMNLKKDI
jgi:hypothetical protein